MKWERLRRFVPYLHLRIDIPWFSIATQIMWKSETHMEYEYILLTIKIIKWDFEFALYNTMKRKRYYDNLEK